MWFISESIEMHHIRDSSLCRPSCSISYKSHSFILKQNQYESHKLTVCRDIKKSLIFLPLRSRFSGCGGNRVWSFYIIYSFNNVIHFYAFELYPFFRNVCSSCWNKNDPLEIRGYVMQIMAFTSSPFVFIFFLVCNKHNIKSHG